MKLQLLVCFVLLTIVSINDASAFKILGVFPTFSKSHFIVGNALMEGLAKQGHEVTMLSSFKPKTIVGNYTHIECSGINEHMKGKLKSF